MFLRHQQIWEHKVGKQSGTRLRDDDDDGDDDDVGRKARYAG